MPDVRGRYFGWQRDHPEWAEVPLDAFTDIWRYAATTALRASANFAEQIALMRELIWWLEAGEGDGVERHEAKYHDLDASESDLEALSHGGTDRDDIDR